MAFETRSNLQPPNESPHIEDLKFPDQEEKRRSFSPSASCLVIRLGALAQPKQPKLKDPLPRFPRPTSPESVSYELQFVLNPHLNRQLR